MKPRSALAAVAFALAVAAFVAAPARAASPVAIVAAENFYGDVASQVGGPDVRVTSILSNPDQDPHMFEASPSVARAIAAARIVIYSGIDYDPWMEKLLGAAKAADRHTIVVAALAGHRTGDNPHVWYDPAIMLAFAGTLADELDRIDPEHRAAFAERLTRFRQSMQPVMAKITTLRARLAGTPVTATEPVFGYMFAALDMRVRNMAFQMAVMNDTEPSASAVAAFENDLKTHAVRLLVYNSQATDPIAERMEKLARAAHVPVVGATETEPPGNDLSGLDDARAGRDRSRAAELARDRDRAPRRPPCPRRARHPRRRQPRRSCGRVRRRAGAERGGQDHAAARRARAGGAAIGHAASAGATAVARQFRDRLHAAGARAGRLAAIARPGLRRRRAQRPPARPADRRLGGARGGRSGARSGRRARARASPARGAFGRRAAAAAAGAGADRPAAAAAAG